jgi:hypothetical protein
MRIEMKAGCVLVMALALATATYAGDKKNKFWIGQRPDQTIALNTVPEVVAEQACPNFAFGAAMEAILRAQGVDALDQNFWVGKLNGDTTCRPIPSYELLQRMVEGDYTVGINRRVRLTVRYTNAFPPVTDVLIVPLSQQRPYILGWKNGLFVVTGITWHETYFHTGQKIVEITRIGMMDLTSDGDERMVEFARGKNEPAELGGMFEVIVTPLDR